LGKHLSVVDRGVAREHPPVREKRDDEQHLGPDQQQIAEPDVEAHNGSHTRRGNRPEGRLDSGFNRTSCSSAAW
jgi:hypothetical protein